MSVLLWLNGGNGSGEVFKKVVEDLVPREDLEVFTDLSSFTQRLRRPGLTETIAVLVAKTQDDLAAVSGLRTLINGLRIVLVLPDRGRETVTRGHMLCPRFLTYLDSPPEDLGAVLSRLVKFLKHRNALEGYQRRHLEKIEP